jgi:hypothetical protein
MGILPSPEALFAPSKGPPHDLTLAGTIICGFPGTLVWVLGLLVGSDLLSGGAALIAMASEACKSGK